MHEIQDVEAILRFIRAGNASFTLKSTRTDKHYSYNVSLSSKNEQTHFVNVNAGDRRVCVGTIWQGHRFKSLNAHSGKGFDYFWRWMIERNQVPQDITFYHEGRCGRCGRALTDPDSIERGLGPECAGK